MTVREIELIRKLAMLISKRTYFYLKIEEEIEGEADQSKINKYNNKILDLREKISDVEMELMELEVVN